MWLNNIGINFIVIEYIYVIVDVVMVEYVLYKIIYMYVLKNF